MEKQLIIIICGIMLAILISITALVVTLVNPAAGIKGAKGDQGAKGDKGDPGA